MTGFLQAAYITPDFDATPWYGVVRIKTARKRIRIYDKSHEMDYMYIGVVLKMYNTKFLPIELRSSFS